jgi:hypothetical protein
MLAAGQPSVAESMAAKVPPQREFHMPPIAITARPPQKPKPKPQTAVAGAPTTEPGISLGSTKQPRTPFIDAMRSQLAGRLKPGQHGEAVIFPEMQITGTRKPTPTQTGAATAQPGKPPAGSDAQKALSGIFPERTEKLWAQVHGERPAVAPAAPGERPAVAPAAPKGPGPAASWDPWGRNTQYSGNFERSWRGQRSANAGIRDAARANLNSGEGKAEMLRHLQAVNARMNAGGGNPIATR